MTTKEAITGKQRILNEFEKLKLDLKGERVVIALVNRKGGAGKTSMLRGLISAAQKDGLSAVAIDTDPQRNLYSWGQKTGLTADAETKNQAYPSVVIEAAADVAELDKIIDSHEDKDIVFVDTPGTVGNWSLELAELVDLIVTPVILSPSDFQTTQETLQMYRDLSDSVVEPMALPFHVCAASRYKPDAQMVSIHKQLIEELSASFPLCSFPISERTQYLNLDTGGMWQDWFWEKMNQGGLSISHAESFADGLEESMALLGELHDLAIRHVANQREAGVRD